MTRDEYIALDATAMASLVRHGEVNASELLDAAIARHDEVNPTLAATTRLFTERAYARISKIDRKAPFGGVPFLIKDLFTDLAGTVCENGSDFHLARPAPISSTVVDAYEQGGFLIFGRTHSPEFGGASTSESRRYGITRNPFDLSRSAGGSSGGAAAAVAGGIVPAAQATDAGGSIGIPASCCGLFGMKPTRGLVPLGPARSEGAGGLAMQHVLTRSVRDSAAILDLSAAPAIPGVSPAVAAAGYAKAGKRELPRLRIASVSTSIHGLAPARECADALARAAALCTSLGHHVEPADLPVSASSHAQAELSLRLASIVHTIDTIANRIGRAPLESDLEPATWQRYRAGLAVTGSDILDAREKMLSTMVAMEAFLARYDVILTPTMADPPPRPGEVSLDRIDPAAHDNNRRLTTFCGLYNWSGQPSMSVPLHRSADGMPIGVLFAARYGADELLFRLAFELEAACPWTNEAPPILAGSR